MAIPKRWAVREAAIASFYDITTNALKVSLNTLKMTEVQTTGETVYSMGGRGNAKLVAFSGNREATVTIQDAIFDNEALSMLTGNGVNTAYSAPIQKSFVATIAANTITLPTETGTFAILSVVKNSTKVAFTKVASAPTAGQYSVASNVLTFNAADTGEMTVVYTVTKTGATQIKVSSDKFAGTYRLVCDVIVRDELDGKDYYGQFIAPKAKINDEFTINFSPDGDPSVLDIPIEILKPQGSTTMWELVIYDEV